MGKIISGNVLVAWNTVELSHAGRFGDFFPVWG